MAPVDLSVVVVSFNTVDCLDACLRSVFAAKGVEIEVFVVDNDSRDGSADMVEAKYPAVTLVRNAENVGFARAVNQGLRLSTGRYALLLNSDAEPIDDAFAEMVRFMDRSPDVGILGPQLRHPDGTVQPSGRKIPSKRDEMFWTLSIYRLFRRDPRARYFDPTRDYSQIAEVEEVSGACMLIRRDVMEKVGLLDEHYFFCFEDMDYCLGATRAGWRVVYYPGARVMHHWGKSSAKSDYRLRLKFLEGYFYFLRRVHGMPFEVLMRSCIALKALANICVQTVRLAARRDGKSTGPKAAIKELLVSLRLTSA